jgi:hypothetical protein
MGEEPSAELGARHETQRDTALTARERQTWQDVATLLAEVERLRALLAGLVAACPGDVRSTALDAARDYLAKTPDEEGA